MECLVCYCRDSGNQYGYFGNKYQQSNIIISSISLDADFLHDNNYNGLHIIQEEFLRILLDSQIMNRDYELSLLIFRKLVKPFTKVEYYYGLWKWIIKETHIKIIKKSEENIINTNDGVLFWGKLIFQ